MTMVHQKMQPPISPSYPALAFSTLRNGNGIHSNENGNTNSLLYITTNDYETNPDNGIYGNTQLEPPTEWKASPRKQSDSDLIDWDEPVYRPITEYTHVAPEENKVSPHTQTQASDMIEAVAKTLCGDNQDKSSSYLQSHHYKSPESFPPINQSGTMVTQKQQTNSPPTAFNFDFAPTRRSDLDSNDKIHWYLYSRGNRRRNSLAVPSGPLIPPTPKQQQQRSHSLSPIRASVAPQQLSPLPLDAYGQRLRTGELLHRRRRTIAVCDPRPDLSAALYRAQEAGVVEQIRDLELV